MRQVRNGSVYLTKEQNFNRACIDAVCEAVFQLFFGRLCTVCSSRYLYHLPFSCARLNYLFPVGLIRICSAIVGIEIVSTKN